MKDEEINVAIAEACGWSRFKTYELDGRIVQYGFPKDSPNYYESPIPNYCNDLNAMHEAEKALTPRECEAYERWLMDFNTSGGEPCKYYQWHATARQRAEAFLRTIGKWKEEA